MSALLGVGCVLLKLLLMVKQSEALDLLLGNLRLLQLRGCLLLLCGILQLVQLLLLLQHWVNLTWNLNLLLLLCLPLKELLGALPMKLVEVYVLQAFASAAAGLVSEWRASLFAAAALGLNAAVTAVPGDKAACIVTLFLHFDCRTEPPRLFCDAHRYLDFGDLTASVGSEAYPEDVTATTRPKVKTVFARRRVARQKHLCGG